MYSNETDLGKTIQIMIRIVDVDNKIDFNKWIFKFAINIGQVYILQLRPNITV